MSSHDASWIYVGMSKDGKQEIYRCTVCGTRIHVGMGRNPPQQKHSN